MYMYMPVAIVWCTMYMWHSHGAITAIVVIQPVTIHTMVYNVHVCTLQ